MRPRSCAKTFATSTISDGLFSGYDPESGTYATLGRGDMKAYQRSPAAGSREHLERADRESDAAQRPRMAGHAMGGHGARLAHAVVQRDETLQHPRCVFQVLKRHFARYTPELVAQTCGVPPEVFAKVCEAVTANSGRDRTTAWVYSVGWTQHSVGVQYIRTAAIIQLLLGNIGRPGGGIIGAAWPREHPGLHGYPDPLRLAAWLSADAQGRWTRRHRRVPGRDFQPDQKDSGPRPGLTWSACSSRTGVTRPSRGERLLLPLPAQAYR